MVCLQVMNTEETKFWTRARNSGLCKRSSAPTFQNAIYISKVNNPWLVLSYHAPHGPSFYVAEYNVWRCHLQNFAVVIIIYSDFGYEIKCRCRTCNGLSHMPILAPTNVQTHSLDKLHNMSTSCFLAVFWGPYQKNRTNVSRHFTGEVLKLWHMKT